APRAHRRIVPARWRGRARRSVRDARPRRRRPSRRNDWRGARPRRQAHRGSNGAPRAGRRAWRPALPLRGPGAFVPNLVLVRGARVGGAATDRAAQERGAVLGAPATRYAGHLQPAKVGTAALGEFRDRRAEVAKQARNLGWRERARGARRVESGAPEHLVGDEVAEPGDTPLVHQPCGAVGESGAKLGGRDRRGVKTEPRLVWVQLDTTEPARVVDAEVAAVVKAHREPVPRGLP